MIWKFSSGGFQQQCQEDIWGLCGRSHLISQWWDDASFKRSVILMNILIWKRHNTGYLVNTVIFKGSCIQQLLPKVLKYVMKYLNNPSSSKGLYFTVSLRQNGFQNSSCFCQIVTLPSANCNANWCSVGLRLFHSTYPVLVNMCPMQSHPLIVSWQMARLHALWDAHLHITTYWVVICIYLWE